MVMLIRIHFCVVVVIIVMHHSIGRPVVSNLFVSVGPSLISLSLWNLLLPQPYAVRDLVIKRFDKRLFCQIFQTRLCLLLSQLSLSVNPLVSTSAFTDLGTQGWQLVKFFMEIRAVFSLVDFADKVLLHLLTDVKKLIALAYKHFEVVVGFLNLIDVHFLKLLELRLRGLTWVIQVNQLRTTSF